MTAAELAFNRLATPVLRPPGDAPPMWHTVLDHIGLFSHYFASILAIGIIVHTLWRSYYEFELYGDRTSYLLIAAGAVFATIAMLSMVIDLDERQSFWFESSFIAVLVVIVLIQFVRPGDLGVTMGIGLLVLPHAVHYYIPIAARFTGEFDEEQFRLLSQWFLVVVALATPYCLAPRPFFSSAARLGPLVVAMLVSIIGVIMLRQHYEDGMRLAQHGLGIHLGPGAPTPQLALYLIALGTMTWTLASTLSADAVSRREIGIGLALIVLGGFSFTWPLQYLVSVVGMLVISESSALVIDEEPQHDPHAPKVRTPPIDDEVWFAYLDALCEALKVEDMKRPEPAPLYREPVEGTIPQRFHYQTMSFTTRGYRDYGRETYILSHRRGLDLRVSIQRMERSILNVNIWCGSSEHFYLDQRSGYEPAWTLYARSERLLGIGAHPEPSGPRVPVHRVGDKPFDDRFRIRDEGGLTDRLLDEGMRAQATALIDGWIAYWPPYGLRYQVEPGHGAPVDHPIPISEMASRGMSSKAAVERLLTVIDFLIDVTTRGFIGRPAADEPKPAGEPTDSDS
ncbi:MAG: hypothetical protein AAGC55_19820 [Myxococcota bacterium]